MSKRVKPKRNKEHRPKRVASNNMFLAVQIMYTTGLDLKKAGAALEQLNAQARAGRMPSIGMPKQEPTHV